MANAPLAGQDGGSHSSDLPDGASGMFFREGLDHPNHFDPLEEISVFARRPLAGFGSGLTVYAFRAQPERLSRRPQL